MTMPHAGWRPVLIVPFTLAFFEFLHSLVVVFRVTAVFIAVDADFAVVKLYRPAIGADAKRKTFQDVSGRGFFFRFRLGSRIFLVIFPGRNAAGWFAEHIIAFFFRSAFIF